ncbi:MAG: DEAD/DEAH box helicase family protein [Candidatus Bathyarchaeia archaeon]
MIVLRFERGTVVAEGGAIPFGVRDASNGTYRAPAHMHSVIVKRLASKGVEFRDETDASPPIGPLSTTFELRDYQDEALDAWRQAGRRGVVVLPTGAGKTVLALKAIEELGEATLVVVPTLVLVDQWREELEEAFGVDVGVLGGGRRDVRPITVSTYDSASILAPSIGNRFRLLVLDEVHHLPAPSYRRIGFMYTAPYRLGLTATLSKDEGALEATTEMVGELVYESFVDDLAGVHLSEYSIRTVQVPLSEKERLEYDRRYSQYRGYLQRRGIKIRSAKDYQRFVQRTGRDPEARRALLARNRAMDLAQNSSSKVEYLKGLLEENRDEKAIIFTRHNKLVYRVSREMLIPAITHQTPREEREEILDGFKAGRYLRVVTSQVLDEGVNVPDASLAVILSGTGSGRQFIQRLGRVLRKKGDKRAKLVELVSMGTAETRTSRRRKR